MKKEVFELGEMVKIKTKTFGSAMIFGKGTMKCLDGNDSELYLLFFH